VFREIPAGHPHRDKLERSGSDAKEGDDIRVFQAFPYHSLLVERLWVASVMSGGESSRMIYFCRFLRTVIGVHPNAFDANLRIVEGPFIHVTRTS
jgi:hypothetical protein